MSDSEIVRVHKACLEAVTAPARLVLNAFNKQRDEIGDSDLDDEQPVTLQISTDLGTLRRLRAHLAHHGDE